jgi:putative membrane protein
MYLFCKWLHIVAVISWMAGLLYIYRLFIYHMSHGQKSKDNHEMLTIMERKLYRIITVPAMSVAWIAGLSMIHFNPMIMKQGWLHSKLLCVVLLTVFTVYAGVLHRRLRDKRSGVPSVRSLKFINEGPTILMMIIVALVIFRP